MASIGIIKVSSKGQIVIPLDMREGLKEGDRLVIIKNKDQIILKKAEHFDKNLEEDLEFARKTEKAYRRHEKGNSIEMDFDEFIEEMKKW